MTLSTRNPSPKEINFHRLWYATLAHNGYWINDEKVPSALNYGILLNSVLWWIRRLDQLRSKYSNKSVVNDVTTEPRSLGYNPTKPFVMILLSRYKITYGEKKPSGFLVTLDPLVRSKLIKSCLIK